MSEIPFLNMFSEAFARIPEVVSRMSRNRSREAVLKEKWDSLRVAYGRLAGDERYDSIRRQAEDLLSESLDLLVAHSVQCSKCCRHSAGISARILDLRDVVLLPTKVVLEDQFRKKAQETAQEAG